MLCSGACTSSPPAVINGICGRFAPIVISDASALHLTTEELRAIVGYNDKLARECGPLASAPGGDEVV